MSPEKILWSPEALRAGCNISKRKSQNFQIMLLTSHRLSETNKMYNFIHVTCTLYKSKITYLLLVLRKRIFIDFTLYYSFLIRRSICLIHLQLLNENLLYRYNYNAILYIYEHRKYNDVKYIFITYFFSISIKDIKYLQI